MMKAQKSLYLVIPCYNEHEVLPETSKQLKNKLNILMSTGKISSDSRICFVNDGSSDNTWQIISDLHEHDKIFSGICLSRNRGHQNALLAGLMTVKDFCDFTISLDSDLQDDINCIDIMVDKFYEGCDIVYGVRKKRDTDSFFKKISAEGFYKFISFMGAQIVYNHSDYRMMSKRAVEGLAEFKEVNLFLRGMVPMIGFKSDKVYYDRLERFAGESKYPFKKMLFFALQGITSLTVEPIRFITEFGLLVFVVSILILLWTLYRHFTGDTITGWTSIMVSVWAIGGAILFAIGIIGEYIGKIYLESKHRPRYIVSEFLNEK
jgi:glycosyltransferase involved in cell wall biosynthesis